MVVPATLVADIVTDPAPHLEPFMGDVAAAGTTLIDAVTAVRLPEMQPVVMFLVCP